MTDHDPQANRETIVRRHDEASTGSHAPTGTTGGDGDTTTGILADLRADGVTAQFVPGADPGSMRCTECEQTSPAGGFEVVAERRMEGTSDPDDMVLIVAARCPVCRIAGAIVLGYGPEASATDADLVVALSSQPVRTTRDTTSASSAARFQPASRRGRR
jgi:hypothetical protein